MDSSAKALAGILIGVALGPSQGRAAASAAERPPRTPAEIEAARARLSGENPLNSSQDPDSLIQNLRTFLERNANDLRSPEDFICSMPRSLRESRDVIAAPASLAAQSGTPRSPRAFVPVGNLEDRRGAPTPPLAVFTVNGGVDGVHQGNAIEFARFLRNGAIEYYDIDFNENPPRLSEPNPETCMSCHGRTGVVGIARVRPLVERVPWVSFLGVNMEQRLCSQAEVDAYRAMRGMTEAVARDNPRLRCLGPRAFAPTPDAAGTTRLSEERIARIAAERARARAQGTEPPDSEPPLQTNDPVRRFDRAMDAVNARQIAQLIRQTPDFDRYKFVLVGLDVCPIRDFSELKQWVPDSELARLTDLSAVAPALRQAANPAAGLQEELRRMEAEDAARARRLETYARNPRRETFPLFSENVTACLTDARRRELIDDVRDATSQNRTYATYVADSVLHVTRDAPDSTQPMLRFLLEGRGVSMRSWNIEPIHDRYSRPLSGYALDVVRSEPEGSLLRSLFQVGVRDLLTGEDLIRELQRPRRENRDPVTQGVVRRELGIPANRAQLCLQLKTSSRQALSRPPAQRQGAQPAGARQ